MIFVGCFAFSLFFPSSPLLELRATLLDGRLNKIKNDDKGESSEEAEGSSKLKRINLDFGLNDHLLRVESNVDPVVCTEPRRFPLDVVLLLPVQSISLSSMHTRITMLTIINTFIILSASLTQ